MMHWLYFWHRLFFMKYIKCKADIYYEKKPLWLVYVPYPTDTMKTSVSIHETCMKCGIADSLSCQHLQQHRGCFINLLEALQNTQIKSQQTETKDY